MPNPLFSSNDKAQFFDVIKEINTHLHHVKQYDKVEDIEKLLVDFQEQLIEVTKKFKSIFEIPSMQARFDETSRSDEAGYLLRKVFRKHISVEQKQAMIREHYKFPKDEDITLDQVGELDNARNKMLDSVKILLRKLEEMQEDRELYFSLVDRRLKHINQDFQHFKNGIKKNLNKIEGDLKNFIGQADDTNANPKKEFTDFFKEYYKDLAHIKEHLNAINIYRSIIRGVDLYHNSFKSELLKKEHKNIRKREDWVIVNDLLRELDTGKIKTWKAFNQDPFWDKILMPYGFVDFNKLVKNVFRSIDLKDGEVYTQHKIIARAFTVFKNLYERFLPLEIKQEDSFKRFQDDILQNILPSFETKITSWSDFFKKLSLIIDEEEDDEKVVEVVEVEVEVDKEENENVGDLEDIKKDKYKGFKRFKFDLNRQINYQLEAVNLNCLIESLSTNPLLILNHNELIKFENLEDVGINRKAQIGIIFQELKNNEIEKDQAEETHQKAAKDLRNYLYQIKGEIDYYLKCSERHIKLATGTLKMETPILYDAYDIENVQFKKFLKEISFKFSFKFRRIIKSLDHFLCEPFFRNLADKNGMVTAFKATTKEILNGLDELKVRKYNILTEFLRSKMYTNTTDRLQIYGGAFGIWSQESQSLIRLQDRRYTNIDYRPYSRYQDPWYRKNSLDDKWYDLPERTIENGKWIKNKYEGSIDLMFFTERKQQLRPEFYQNFSSDKNLLNEIERKNQFLFSEDGEIGAFILLYRFLNAVFNTEIGFGEEDEKIRAHFKSFKLEESEDLEKSENPILEDIRSNYVKEVRKYLKENPNKEDREKLLGAFFNYHKRTEEKRICLGDYLIMLAHQLFFRAHKPKNDPIKKKVSALLYKFLTILLSAQNPIKFSFHPKELSDSAINHAYDDQEARARAEKFYGDMNNWIDLDKKGNFFQELKIQGLLMPQHPESTQEQIEEISEDVTVTERFINLCKFIGKELNPSKKHLKLKCNFNGHNTPLNPEQYFIDQKTNKEKVEELLGSKEDAEEFINQRKEHLNTKIREKILEFLYKNVTIAELRHTDFTDNIAAILSLLLESMLSFSTSKDFMKEVNKLKGHLLELDERTNDIENDLKYKDLKKGVWFIVKEQIDDMCKFPISPYFVWRANRPNAHSSVVLPIASTSINQKAPNVGFLIIGLRNILKNHLGEIIHITHDRERELKELIFSIRSVYEPLIWPFMDKIYYGEIESKLVQENATRAAVARVMSRNLSHNVGSHVLERLTTSLADPHRKDEECQRYVDRNLTNLFSYLRTRMGFIADVSTGKPHITVAANLKKDVLKDFLKKEEKIDGTIADNIKFQKILFDNISGNRNKNSEHIDIKIVSSTDQDDSLLAAMPNGTFGNHAFFAIIENIIRNAFKHSEVKDNLTIALKFEQGGHFKDYIQVKATDNLGEHNKKIRIIEGDIKDKIQKKLDRTIIDPVNKKLRAEDWGLLEMKIAAAYLRKIDVVEIDKFTETSKHDLSQPPLVTVDLAPNGDLCYIFYIPIPKEIEVLDFSVNKEKVNIPALEKVGIKYQDVEAGKAKELIPAPCQYNFKIVLGLDGDNWEEDYKINPDIERIMGLPCCEEEFRIALKELNLEEMLRIVWDERTRLLKERNLSANAELPLILDYRDHNEFMKYGKNVDKFPMVTITTNHKNHIVFDNHGRFVKSTPAPNRFLYYEPYQSINPTAILLNELYSLPETPSEIGERNWKNTLLNNTLKYDELVEIAFTDIGIIDERIQGEAHERTERKPTERKGDTYRGLELKRVFVPKKEDPGNGNFINLNALSVLNKDKFKGGLKNWLEGIIPEFKRELDFLLIHITIVEKIAGTSPSNIKKFVEEIEEWDCFKLKGAKNKHKNNKKGKVILISGRGNPSNIPPEVPFLHYSTIARYLFEQPSKYYLTKILFAASMNKGSQNI